MESESNVLTAKELKKPGLVTVLKSSGGLYRRLFGYLKPYKPRFVLGLIFGGLFGAANGALVWTIKHVGEAVFPGGADKAAMIAAGSQAGGEEVAEMLLLCAAVPAIMIVRGVCSYLNAYFMLWVSIRVLDDIRTQLFGHLMHLSMAFYDRAKVGELIQVVFGRTRMAQQTLTQMASDIIRQPVSVLSALVALFWIDWKFTLCAFLVLPLCVVPVIIIGKKVRHAGNKEEEEAANLMVAMQEAFAGYRLVKTEAQENYETERFGAASRKMLASAMRWRKAIEMSGPAVETVASLGVSAALLYAWYFELGAAKFLALQGGLVLLYPPLKQISRLHLLMQKCAAATSKVFVLLDRDAEIKDEPGAGALAVTEGRIRFEKVSFGYRRKDIIHDIDIEVAPGTTCALVGPSGAGKTTLFSLLLRLYEVRGGRVLIDGADVRQVTQKSLRSRIAIVSQDTFLFHDSILNNIRYGMAGATPEQVEEVARLAYAHEFIVKNPAGYHAVVGDRGCTLSGGQRQRIAIARALLKNAPILLLDEATSALDSESEKQIQAALENLAVGRTVLAIAHRLSTVLKADQIVVMESGRVCEVGTHPELFAKAGVYRRLYDMQFKHDSEQPLLVGSKGDAAPLGIPNEEAAP
jgi:subfamily B ATP-binding cassette protein MsbA